MIGGVLQMGRARAGRASVLATAVVLVAASALASEPNGQKVNHFVGAAGESVGIQVPAFHGIEPRLSLSYSSEARNGIAGMGWSLNGFSVIEGVVGSGAPMTLDGQALMQCQAGWSYPSCATGGTHYTLQESYLRIKKVSDALWEVYGKDGTKTEFTSIYVPPGATIPSRYGQTKTIDTHGNFVKYVWDMNVGGISGNTYPKSITYQGSPGSEAPGYYQIEFFREARPDPVYLPSGWTTAARQTERLKTIVVSQVGGSPIRAYKLTYSTSGATGKSLLGSVQQYGKDVQITAGAVTGGTSLPAQTFTYTPDPSAASFGGDVAMGLSGPPPTAPGTVENVVWWGLYGASAVGNGNTIEADVFPPEQEDTWRYGNATRRIASGAGYLEFTYTYGTGNRVIYFGQHSLYLYSGAQGILFSYGSGWLGPYSASPGQLVRIEITPTSVQFKINGSTVVSQAVTTNYPAAMASYLWEDGDRLSDMRLSGALTNAASADCTGSKRWPGDFNGDGRQDSVCRTAAGNVVVTLATATGFANPVVWASAGNYLSGVGDFNNDGKDDVLFFDSYWGRAYVGLSNAQNFGAITSWGVVIGYDYAGYPKACSMQNGTYAYISGVADFNGDGKMDLSCRVPFVQDSHVFAYSTGSSFTGISGGGCSATDNNDYAQGIVDWNGDGMDDWYCIAASGNQDLTAYVSFGSAGILTSFCTMNEYALGDFNGDGMTDAACANNGRVVLRAPSGAWIDQGATTAYCLGGQRLTGDLDGDGSAEWLCNNSGTPANDIQVRRWIGGVLAAPTTWKSAFCAGTVALADYNGDGKKDLLCESSQVVAYAGTKDTKADLLVSTSNGIGGSSTLTWATSTSIARGPTGGISYEGVPPKYLVQAVTVNAGRAPSPLTTNFAYWKGVQNDQERKFFGFAIVVEFPPKLATESESPSIVRSFFTDKLRAGRLSSISRWSGPTSAKVLSQTDYEYTTTETTGVGARRTALLTAMWDYKYTGLTGTCVSWPCANGKRMRKTFTYDNYGSVLNTTDFGEVGAVDKGGIESPLSGDETLAVNYYPPNTTAYIVGLVGARNVWQGITNVSTPLLSSEVTAYDGATWWSTPPTKGDATARYSWIVQQNRYTGAATSTYDSWGNVLTSTDPTGKTVTATYDATYHLFPLTVVNGASETTATAWDFVCGVPATTTDPNLVVTTQATDALCRPITTTLPSPYGTIATTTYSAMGDPNAQYVQVETPGPDGQPDWTQSYFDGLGRTYRTVKRGPSTNESIVSDVQFNERGGVDQQTAPYYANGTAKITTFAYDYFDRPTVTTQPGGKTRVNAFPALSAEGLFQTTQTNELGQSSTTKFDVFGRVRREEKWTLMYGTLVTTRNYDVLGRMTSLVDPAGNTWTYTYDSLGRNLAKSDPDAGTWTYTYDDAGRVLTQTDAKNQTTTLTYDGAGRLSTKANPTETVTTTYSQAHSSYFNVGRPTTLASSLGNGTLQFDYDALGQVVRQTRTIDGTNYTVKKSYDSAGYLRGIEYPDGDYIGDIHGVGLTPLVYDGAGRLSGIPGIVTSVTYNALGAPLVQTNANGTTTTKTYDANRFWLKTIGTTSPSLTLQNLGYTLNDAGMATAVTSPFGTEGWSYGYDELNRLNSSYNTGSPGESQNWTYDNIGRITYNSRVGNYTYSVTKPHAVTVAGNNAYSSYDNNGNLQIGGGRMLTWDANNRITAVSMSSSNTFFAYGPDGDRIKKTAGASVSKYPFGDDYEIAPSGTVTKYFNAGFGVIAKKVGTTLYWLHTDRMGSINATTDGSGAEVLRRSYRSYGELLGQTGTDTESLGYIGQRTDSETGLTYLHARYYDPGLGLFISPDPIGADRNTYRYAGGNPANFVDPSGLEMRGPEGRGGSDEICERFGWSCTAQEAGGGYGGMGGPGPGSSASSEGIGGLPEVYHGGPTGYAYPTANPEGAALAQGYGYVMNPTLGLVYSVQSNPGIQVAGGGGDLLNDLAWNLTQGAAGFGSQVSFGLTDVINSGLGNDSVIDKSSTSFKTGQVGGFALSATFGAAHLGRNAVMQMNGSVTKGVTRLLVDPRKWGTVRDMWSKTAGGGARVLQSSGQSLHHWLIPQRVGQVNAGFNYLPISAGFNSWMNGSTAARWAVEKFFTGSVIGIYGGLDPTGHH